MTLVLILTTGLVFVRAVSTLLCLLQALTWLKRKTVKDSITATNRRKIYVVIPALREQKRIVPTLRYFLKTFKHLNIKIIVVTTQREFGKKFTGASTKEIVEEFVKGNCLTNKIICLNYPDPKGHMAHQLNFALDLIEKDALVAVYNADSRPHPSTFDYLLRQFKLQPNAKVFQQSALFFANFESLGKKGLNRWFLQASAVLQSRWALVHEIPRLIRQSLCHSGFLQKYACAHVVGHGLIIKKKLLRELGGFPTGSITEDLFLGFIVRSKGICIFPVPYLELADSPETLKGLWNQKYVWFWGPMKYPAYLNYVLANRRKLHISNLASPYIIATQGLITALAWLISGPMISLCLLAPFFASNWIIISWSYLSVFIYGPLQYLIVYLNSPKLLENDWPIYRPNWANAIIMMAFSIPAILFNSLPPYLSLLSELASKLTGKEIYKPKTDD